VRIDQVIGVTGDRPCPSKRLVQGQAGVFEPSPVKTFNNPSGRHLQAMTGMESIMIRSLSFGGFIAEKEDMLMNPEPWVDSFLARSPRLS
jgi:hypothetical protein